MGHAAVLVRRPLAVPRDVRRDQPEHFVPLETQRVTSRLGRKTVLSLADMTRLSEHTMRVSEVLCLGDDQEPGARMARRRGTRRPSQLLLGEATLAWHALELEDAHQARERSPQPQAAARQDAPAVHQAVLADEHTRCQLRLRREHRRDVLPAPAGVSDRVGPPRRDAAPAAGQHKGGHDIHGRFQRGP